MFELASLLTYVAVVIGLFLIPGPSVLLALTRTLQGERKVGIATGLGGGNRRPDSYAVRGTGFVGDLDDLGGGV
ncbi:hypothetical protein ACWHY4_18215 [Pseudomonas sp. E2-15]